MTATDNPVRRFRQFFREHGVETVPEGGTERTCLVDWRRLAAFDADVAERLLTYPDAVTGYAREALEDVDIGPAADGRAPRLRVRNLATETPPDALATVRLGRLVSVSGVVEATTAVRPSLTVATVECRHCGTTTSGRSFGLTTPERGPCRSCGRNEYEVVPTDSDAVDAQSARLRVPGAGDADSETIRLRIGGPLTPVTPGTPVTVTGVVRPCRPTDLDRRPTVRTRFVDCRDIAARDATPDPPSTTPWTLGDLASRPTYLAALADAVAPSVAGFRRAKLALALLYVQPTLPGVETTASGPHVLVLAPEGGHRRRLLEAFCALVPGAQFRAADGRRGRPIVADVREGESHCWVETGPLVGAAGSVAVVDAIEHAAETQRPFLTRALTEGRVRLAKAGIELPLDTADRLVAAAAPTGDHPDDSGVGAPLDDAVRSAFDLVLADSAGSTVGASPLTRAWSEGMDTVAGDGNSERPDADAYRSALTRARLLDRPELRDAARTRLHESRTDHDGGCHDHALLAWVATAVARLRGQRTVRPNDVTRAERIAAVLTRRERHGD